MSPLAISIIILLGIALVVATTFWIKALRESTNFQVEAMEAKKMHKDLLNSAVNRGWGKLVVAGVDQTRFEWVMPPEYFKHEMGNVISFRGFKTPHPFTVSTIDNREFEMDLGAVDQMVLGSKIDPDEPDADLRCGKEPDRVVRVVMRDKSARSFKFTGETIRTLINTSFGT